MSSPGVTASTHRSALPSHLRALRLPPLNIRRCAPLAYLVIFIASALAAYWQIFSFFAPYDDSGYFINAIRLFSQGHALYNQVFTDYGPFSYELWAAVFGLAGHTISTDSGRLAIVGLLSLTSLLLGLSCQRLTGRLGIGLVVQVLSFTVMAGLGAEPMHAGWIVGALFGATLAILSFVLPHSPRVGLCALGAVVAALCLTKVNVGGFAVIAVAYTIVMTLPGLQRIVLLRWSATAALVAVGPVLMSGELNHAWAQDYALLAAAGTMAIVLVTGAPDRGGADGVADARRWLLWLMAGLVACGALVIGVVLALGTTLGAMFQETVVVASHQASAFAIPLPLTGDAVYWAVGAVAGAWVIHSLRAGSVRTRHPGPLGAMCRVLAGLAIWFSVVGADPLDISPQNANFALAITLAWVAAIPSTRDDGSPRGRFVRLLIPSLTVLETLMAYPVAGTQMWLGSLLLVVCGAVCLGDGWSDLEAWGARRGTLDGQQAPHAVMTALVAALAVAFAIQYVGRPLETWSNAYASYQSLRIAGATRVHLPPGQASTLTQITALLRAHCKSVITLPGMLSFNLWSGLPAPSGLTSEPFWHQLDHSQERTALADAEAISGLCVVRNDALAAGWDGGIPPPQVPLVSFIEHDFTPIAQYEGYVVSVRS